MAMINRTEEIVAGLLLFPRVAVEFLASQWTIDRHRRVNSDRIFSRTLRSLFEHPDGRQKNDGVKRVAQTSLRANLLRMWWCGEQ